jgi:hypothetical protein
MVKDVLHVNPLLGIEDHRKLNFVKIFFLSNLKYSTPVHIQLGVISLTILKRSLKQK